jgi:hypothetical protein
MNPKVLCQTWRLSAATRLAIAVSVAGTVTTPGRSAQVELVRQTAGPGAKQELALILSTEGTMISSCQVDLRYDPEQISIEVEGSTALEERQKTIYFAMPEHGLLRIILLGLNTNVFQDASIVKLYASPLGNFETENAVVQLVNAVGSTPDGDSVALRTKDLQNAAIPTTGVISLWDDSAIPAVLHDDDSAGVEVGLKFQSDVSGQVLGVRFYKGVNNTGPHIGNLWSATGQLLGTVAFTNETGSGWQQALFAAPISISANTTYVISYYAPFGRYSTTNGYFNSEQIHKPPLRALRSGVDGSNGIYRYSGVSAFPDTAYQATNYWVDVLFKPQVSTRRGAGFNQR